MKSPLARPWHAASFMAGVLIGLSIVAPVFALTGGNASPWETRVLVGSAIVLLLGVVLQAAAIAKSPHEIVLPLIGITAAVKRSQLAASV